MVIRQDQKILLENAPATPIDPNDPNLGDTAHALIILGCAEHAPNVSAVQTQLDPDVEAARMAVKQRIAIAFQAGSSIMGAVLSGPQVYTLADAAESVVAAVPEAQVNIKPAPQ